MKKIAAVAAISVSTLAMSASASFADYTLNILHINDWHSRIESINKFDSTCSAEDEGKGECFGGAARLMSLIEMRRKALEGQNVLLLSAGDNFQGSLFFTTYKGDVEADYLNLMKFDAVAVGNHEFDNGEDGLAAFLDKVQFPVIGSNIHASAKSRLGDRVKPYAIFEVGGQKIAVIGAVTTETPQISSPGPEVTIDDDVAAITKAVDEVTKQGVNKIIALTHIGYVRERDVIAKIPGIDVVVGGHSHSLLSKTDPKAEGPYPTMVDNPDGYKVPVVQAASYSKYLGDLVVTFDDNGVVKEAKGDPILIDKSVPQDEAVLARIKELGAPIEELKAKQIGETAGPIDGSRDNCRVRECEMGDLVADAILDRVKDQGITIAVQNGGGLRASIDAGPVTMGEVLTVLPFQNTLATFQLKGADILASLEHGVSGIEEGKGQFPQVAGLKYSFDKSAAPNAGRIKSVEVMEDGTWKPIDPETVYGVVTNNFMRKGGDGYTLFATNAENAYDYGPNLETVVADYLGTNQPYTPKLDDRITEIGATAAVPEADAAAKKAEEEAAAKAAAEAAAKAEAGAAEAKPAETAAAEAKPTETAAAEAKPADAASTPSSHVIVAGDTYWDLSETLYKDPTKWAFDRQRQPWQPPARPDDRRDAHHSGDDGELNRAN